MRTIFGRLGLALFAFLALSPAGHAQFTYTTNADNTLTITDYSGGSASVTIPSNFNGKTVTRLGDASFQESQYMTSVTIPSSVTNIGSMAFYQCTNLTGAVIPNSVTRLGNSAFLNCYRLSSLTIGSGITLIEPSTFSTCTNLLSVTIPNSVTNIDTQAFEWCSGMTNLTIGTGVKNIGNQSFNYCYALKGLSIPNNVTNIGYRAYLACNSLRNISIGAGVKTIGAEAFSYCGALTNVSIGASVAAIRENAFSQCTNLVNFTIPSNVTLIEGGAFGYCSNLKNVIIPDTVTNLGAGQTFICCTSLTNVTIGTGIDAIGFETFSTCPNLKNATIPNNVKNVGNNAFNSCGGLTNVSIGSGVTNIGNGAFSYCGNLKNVSLPNNVRTIGYMAFYQCTGMTNVMVGNGVGSILYSAFQDCTSLKTAYIGSGVTSLGDSAFSGCANLLGAYFSGNAPGTGASLFDGCNSATVYRLAGATGWPVVPNTWANRPTALWSTTTLSINPTSTNLSSAAASGKTIGVTASVAWTAASNVSWIIITAGASGTTNGTVTFSVATNSAASRTGGIVVAGGGISLTCAVVQAGISAPAAPTGVSATDGTYPDKVQVTWTASSGATGYEVWRFTNSNSSLASKIAQGLAGSPYNDTNVTAGKVYYYWLKATNAAGASALSSSNSGFAQVSAPSAPTGVSATDGSYTNKVRITWTASSGASGYEVWRHTSSNSNSASRIAQGIGGSPYDDNTVLVGTNYYYWLKATNAGGTSVFSNVDSGYASNLPPSAPTGVSASDGTFSDRIRIAWTASGSATGYEVWRSTTSNTGTATRVGQGIAGSPYDDLTVPQGITHYYWVKATNASGASAFSTSDIGLRASTSFNISGTLSYGGAQTGAIHVTATPYFEGQPNIALSLDGVDDGVVVDAPTSVIQLSTQLTMCAWINVTSNLTGSLATVLLKYDTSTNRVAYLLGLNSSDGRPYASFGDGYNFYASLNIGKTSGWTHIAFTHDGTVGRWYVNGQFSSQTTNGSVHRFGNGPLYFGRCCDLLNEYSRFPGQLDDIGLWSRPLSQGEIQGVMTNGMVGTEPGLVSCWNFDDGTANDITTNANNGQFMAGATTANRTATGAQSGTTIAGAGAYSITNVLAGEYGVSAYRDSNGNGMAEPWEACGTYPASPMAVTGNMAGINITLQDPVTDTDGDGVTDYDEIYLYGSSWTNSDSHADGMPDGDEVLAGSSPTDGDSMFGFADSQPVPGGGGVVVSWPSLSNRVYRLERTTNLLLGFEPLANGIPADPPVNSYTDDTPNVIGVYKVGVRME